MANRLGPSWLNRVQQFAGPTHAGRLGRYSGPGGSRECA